MKYRRDFVTNSSSSCFICDICGREECGYDLCLSDIDMGQCVNVHTFCDEDMFAYADKSLWIDKIIENNWNMNYYTKTLIPREDLEKLNIRNLFDNFIKDSSSRPEFCCPICSFKKYEYSDIARYFNKKYEPRPPLTETIDYIVSICKKYDLIPHEVVESWKKEFNSYHDFDEYCTKI